MTSRIENLVFKAADSSNTLIYGSPERMWPKERICLTGSRYSPSVRSVRINIVEEVAYVFDWLEREIGRLAGVSETIFEKPAWAATRMSLSPTHKSNLTQEVVQKREFA